MKNIILFKLYLIVFFSFTNSFGQSYFIENKGQFPSNVIAKKKIPGGALFVEQGKFLFSFYDQIQLKNHHNRSLLSDNIKFHAYSLSFKNRAEKIPSFFLEKKDYIENYYIGLKENWASHASAYGQILQKNIYEGIDLKIYSIEGTLKYDLYLSKEADFRKIKIKYNGHDKIELRKGNLIISTSVNNITELKPFAYQIIDGKKNEVACDFILKNNTVSFNFPHGFNPEYNLVIDPSLVFSTYSGSISDNFGYTATYDDLGYLYSGSTAFGVDYPVTVGAFQENFSGGITDIAITKYDTNGTSRIFSTYLGGSKDELPHSMVVNSNNELFVLGTTGSSDFPVTASAFEDVFLGGSSFFPAGLGVSFPNGSDIFVSRLSNNGGSLLSSTFLGGSENDGLNTAPRLKFNYADEIRGEIDIDNNNNVYIVSSTYSSDFPVTSSAFQPILAGEQDGCIIKMDNQLSTIIWASFLGGEDDDAAYSLALDNENIIYVTGGTVSEDFPTTPFSYNNTYNDSAYSDAFVSKIDNRGSSIIHSTFYGSDQYDQSYFIELNKRGEIYIYGQTNADSNLLVFNANYFTSNGGQFISVFDNDLSSVIRSTVLGTGKGSPDISPTAFLVDKCNNIYISGWGSNLGGALSTLNLPVTSSAFQSTTDGNDFYLAVINEFLDSLEYATYFGGSQSNEHVDGGTSRFDKNGIVYQSVCAGCGNNNDFPTYPNPGAVSNTNNSSNCNNAVFKFDFDRPLLAADFLTPILNCTTSVNFNNTTPTNQLPSVSFLWDFGDGNFSNQINPNHQYLTPGIYNVSLVATSLQACNTTDTITKTIYILSGNRDTLDVVVKCDYSISQIGIPALNDSTINFTWIPVDFLNNTNIPNPYTAVDTNFTYELIVSNNQCNDTLVQEIIVNDLYVQAPNDTSYCSSAILLSADAGVSTTQIHWASSSLFTDTISDQIDFYTSIPKIYFVKVSDSLCYAIDSVEVLSDMIDIDLVSDTLICDGDTVYISVVNNTSVNPIISYSWQPDNIYYNIDSSEIKHTPTSSLWYTVETVNNMGCFIKDSVYVKVSLKPVLDSLWAESNTVYSGSGVTLHANTEDSILWFNSSNDSIITFNVYESSWYNIVVYNDLCVIYDSLYISVRDIFCDEDSIVIPTGFTPNNDNINDAYKIINNGVDLTYFNLKIYNRLGQAVFSTNDINVSWDGKYKGKKLNAQVLDYFLEMTCAGERMMFKKGNITLIE